MLFVSHDRYFIQALAGKIIELKDEKITEFNGTYEEYTAYKAVLKAESEKTKNSGECSPAPAVKQKDTGYRSKEERAAEAKSGPA